MVAGLWLVGTVSLGVGIQGWQETLWVEGDIASRVQCSLRFEDGWHAHRQTDFEQLFAYWPEVSRAEMWAAVGIDAVHRDKHGRLIQIDTNHFQHRLRYREGNLVAIHTRDDWEDHEYIVIWKDGLPVRLVGYLEHIELVYDKNRLLSRVVETWLDEPEIRQEMVLDGPWAGNRFPLPFSMGWLFTRTGRMNPDWLVAWWLSKQRFPDPVARVH